jgi:hypothetical protein
MYNDKSASMKAPKAKKIPAKMPAKKKPAPKMMAR